MGAWELSDAVFLSASTVDRTPAASGKAEALNPTALSESATTLRVLWASWQPTGTHLLAWERLAVLNTQEVRTSG